MNLIAFAIAVHVQTSVYLIFVLLVVVAFVGSRAGSVGIASGLETVLRVVVASFIWNSMLFVDKVSFQMKLLPVHPMLVIWMPAQIQQKT